MQKLFIVVALPLFAALGLACERGDRDLDRDGLADRSTARVDTPYVERDGLTDRSTARVDTPNDDKLDSPAENMAPKFGRGEGEKELDRTGSAGVFDNDGEDKVPEAVVIETYRSMIAEDAVLAAAAGNTRLMVEEGDLVLRGTVATRDLSDSLEDLAKKIANDREIDNKLEIERQ